MLLPGVLENHCTLNTIYTIEEMSRSALKKSKVNENLHNQN